MTRLRLCLLALGISALVFAPSAHAVVGGKPVPEGKYPYVAYIEIDQIALCTGTLVAPTWIVSAGHCASLTGDTGQGVPIAQPPQAFEVSLGTSKAQAFPDIPGNGPGVHPTVKSVTVNPNYNFLLNGSGYDVSLIELSAPVSLPDIKVAGKGEEVLWKPGTMATIAGFGSTNEDGDLPDTMQEAQVPIVTDAYAANAYPDTFESKTQIGAGFDKGGVDTCQGDSGGPLMVPGPNGVFRLAGDTSYGNGCAEPHFPGIYGRVADTTLREWIRSVAPEAVAPDAATTTAKKKKAKKKAARKGTARAHARHATLR